MKMQKLGSLTIFGVAALMASAHAQCSSMAPRMAAALQNMARPSLTALRPVGRDAAQADVSAATADPPLVGLWQVTFTVPGYGVVDQAFEVYHSDGTEMMVDTAPPASDNVCVGVWAKTDASTFKLKHPSWTFDNSGNLNGTAIIRENINLRANSDTFTGTFSVVSYDLSANITFQISGNISGKRITAD